MKAATDTTGTTNRSGRYVGVVGSSFGAAVGRTFVGGTVGTLAGSLVGSVATQEAVRGGNGGQSTSDEPDDNPEVQSYPTGDEEIIRQLERGNSRYSNHHQAPSNDESLQMEEEKPWHFGDRIRQVVKRGKETHGRTGDSSYRFGDFSRGLFSKK